MGKWDGLRSKYSKLPLDGAYQDKVNAILDSPAPAEVLGPQEEGLELTVRCLSDNQVNKLYVKCRDRIDEISAELKTLNLEEEALTRLFVERFEEAGESSKTFEDGVSIGVTVEPYPYVKEQAKLIEWVKAEGMEAMLTLNYMTMASMVKETLEGKSQRPIPPGIEVFLKDKLTCRGRKKKTAQAEGE